MPSSRIRTQRLKAAIEEIKKYQQSSVSPLFIVDPGEEVSPADILIRDFLKLSEVTPTTGLLLDLLNEVTPEDAIPEFGIFFIPPNFEYKTPKQKMFGENSLPYTVEQTNDTSALPMGRGFCFYDVDHDLSRNVHAEDLEDLAPMTIGLVTNPNLVPSTFDADEVAVVMNNLPTLEVSKASPYLNVEFLSQISSKQSYDEGTIKGLTTSRYLLGPDPKGQENYEGYIFAPFVGDEDTAEFGVSTHAGMDLFTAPQTLSPIEDGLYSSPKDPFRPLMSIDGFNLKVISPKVGMDKMGAEVMADITIILHDRKRLDEVARLVSPGGIGNLIKITYGYAHPDGEDLTQKSIEERKKSIYADILNGMRVTEVFQIVNTDFTMKEAGEVTINISASSLGSGKGLKSLDVTGCSLTGDVEFREAQEALNDLVERMSFLRDNKNFTKLVPPQILVKPGSLQSPTVKKQTFKEVMSFKKKLLKKSKEIAPIDGLKAVGLAIDDVFGKDGVLKTASKNRETFIEELISDIKNTSDPFVIATPERFPLIKGRRLGYSAEYLLSKVEADASEDADLKDPWYISLGKLIATVVGLTLRKKFYGSVDEIQMIFYPFNESSGACHDLNIASMLIPFKDFEKVMRAEFKSKGVISLEVFMKILNENFLKSETTPAYGISNLPKGMTQEQALHKIYGHDEENAIEHEFVRPDLNFTIKMLNGTKEMGKDQNLNILRFEVFDKVTSPGHAYTKILKASAESGVYFKVERRSDNAACSTFHNQYQDKYLAPFKDFLVPLSKADFKIPDGTPDEVRKRLEMIQKNGHSVTLDKKSIPIILRTVFPTIVYGTEASGILNATINSRKDPDAVSLAMIRSMTRLKSLKDDDDKGDPTVITEVHPVEASLRTIGCPFFNFGQNFFIDFGTGTNIDNIYTVTDVSHKIAAGEFETTVQLVHSDGYQTLMNPGKSVNKFLESLVRNMVAKSS